MKVLIFLYFFGVHGFDRVSSRNVTSFFLFCCLLSFWTSNPARLQLSMSSSPKMIHDSKCQITSQCEIKLSAQENENVLRGCNIALKDCRLLLSYSYFEDNSICGLSSPWVLFLMLQKRCTFQQTLHFLIAAAVLISARKKNTWDEQRKNALMQFMRGYSALRFSIQFPSLIALLLIRSLPYARCGPDTTDLRVWELSVKVIQESFLKLVRGKRIASHFPQTRRATEWA